MTFMYSQSFLHGFIWNQHNDQLPVGLLGHGFKSRTGLDFFFQPYFHYCSSSVHSYEDLFHIHILYFKRWIYSLLES